MFCYKCEDENGNSYANELTELMLDVYDELNIYNPKIHVRYTKSMPEKLLYKVADMIRRGNSSICILNDDVIFKAYEKIGVPKSDAVNYVVLGCYEPIVMGKEEAEIGASWTNIAKAIENNWQGYEKIRAIILNDEERYGNNCERPDKIMCDLVNHINDLLKKLKAEGVNTAVDTSCYAEKEDIDKVLPFTDTFLCDIKTFDEKLPSLYMHGVLPYMPKTDKLRLVSFYFSIFFIAFVFIPFKNQFNSICLFCYDL